MAKIDTILRNYSNLLNIPINDLKKEYNKLSHIEKQKYKSKLEKEIEDNKKNTTEKKSKKDLKKDSENWYKNLLQRVKTDKGKLKVEKGYFYFFQYKSYNYPDYLSYYDTQPLIFLLDNYTVGGKRYWLGINFHWLNKSMRLNLLKNLYKTYSKYFENNLPIPFSYEDIKSLRKFKFAYVIIRKYIRENIKKRILKLDHKEIFYSINLDTHKFLGITPENAWKLSINKMK